MLYFLAAADDLPFRKLLPVNVEIGKMMYVRSRQGLCIITEINFPIRMAVDRKGQETKKLEWLLLGCASLKLKSVKAID